MNDLEVLIKRARIAAGIDWDIMCSLGVRNILRECANAIESLRKAERDYGETLDAIRRALGQEGTHYLVMADDVRELVEAIERDDSSAKKVLEKLREREWR